MAARDVPDRISHGQNSETKGEGDTIETNPSCGKDAATMALPQPPNTSQKVPTSSARARVSIFIGFSA